ncbi:MAG: hypothetical protein JW847_09630 [Candidatus Omnitrophica bacterium]|nr:hypothetical protein [Candidatus Omnitrophota bacterium]
MKPADLPEEAVVLSFLKPSVEEEMRKQGKTAELIFARQKAADVKQKALDMYVEMVAQLGTVSLKDGKTLRKALEDGEGISSWWFHPVSRKYCEGEPTFNHIIQILAISQVAEDHGCSHIIVYGGPYEIADALGKRFFVSAQKCRNQNSWMFDYILPLMRRFKFLIVSIYELIVLKSCVTNSKPAQMDVLFSGFWDWSVWEDGSSKKLVDRYFQAVPEKVKKAGMEVGWLAWVQHTTDPNKTRRSIQQAIKPLRRHPEIIIVQCFLTIVDILKAVIDLRPFLIFWRYRNVSGLKGVLCQEGLDFSPLFRGALFAGFLDSTIPRHALIMLAHQKAASHHRPKSVLSFLDFFLHARAVNAGIKKGCPSCVLVDVQHASYSREKTFGIFQPNIEVHGNPDGCMIPHPDYICAMGELGREIFIEGGADPERVLMTGSSRYDGATRVDAGEKPKTGISGKRILIVTTLQKMGSEFEMVDTVHEAFRQFPDVSLSLRSHPFFRMQDSPEFQPYKDRIQCTSGTSLDDDLNKADIVLFSYSTVAEEAFIRGIPVWQWITAGYNASVFRDIGMVPTFFSVESLVRVYRRFLESPDKYVPSVEQRKLVKRKCFFDDNGSGRLPSDNIAELLATICGKKHELSESREYAGI